MQKTTNIPDIEALAYLTDKTRFLAYDPEADKVGYATPSMIDTGYEYFARVWNTDNATPVAQGWTGSLEFGKTIADQLGLGCYLVKADHSRRKLDPSNHYLFANGETAKLDGSMGHYQWGWGKPWYYSVWQQGNLWFEALSLQPIRGQYSYLVPVATMSADGHACYDRTIGALCSLVNSDANYRGGNNTSDWDGTSCGVCADQGDLLGTISYAVPGADDTTYQTVSIACFYGLVHAGWGHLWRWCVDEMGMANSDKSITHYMADDLTGTWNLSTGVGMTAYSSMPTGGGFIKKTSLDNFEAFPTVISGASESTFFTDQGWNTSGITSVVRAVARGALAHHGGHSGSFAVTVSSALSYAHAFYGSPLNNKISPPVPIDGR